MPEIETGLVRQKLRLGLWQAKAGASQAFMNALRDVLDASHGLDEVFPQREPLVGTLLNFVELSERGD